ncbi:MAG: Fic family protein [Alphaproteobacteria bacterium]|nr:Fic family protein [Alphaproteobacteria bacterium]
MSNYTLADGVLKNKLGATTQAELAEREASAVRLRMTELRLGIVELDGSFDADHLKEIHHHLFQDVYEWAGHTRHERVSLADGTVATMPIMRKEENGQSFLLGPLIQPRLDDVASKLAEADYLRGLERADFAHQAADVFSEINGIHAFREGNGRTQRAFIRQLAEQAGHHLDFTAISQERMIQASIAANAGDDPSMMRRMFDEISDPARVALLREGIGKLSDAYEEAARQRGETSTFDWNRVYVATVAPGHSLEATFVGEAGDQFMARADEQILFGFAADLPSPRPVRGAIFRLDIPPRDRFSEMPKRANEQAAVQKDGLDDGKGGGRGR